MDLLQQALPGALVAGPVAWGDPAAGAAAARGTRLLPPELLWQAAQGGPHTVLAPWLARP